MTERCMQCGRCSASCPAAIEMDMPPHRWVSRVRNGDVASVQGCEAIWLCVGCFCCVERCPRGVRPVDLGEEARAVTLRKKSHEALLPDGIPAKVTPVMPQQLVVAALRKKR